MDNRGRWIAVRVDMLEHEILQGDPYSRRDAWLWLIANAAWKDHQARTRAGIIDLRRGEVLAGLEHLAKKWCWSVKKVRTFLRDLIDAGMIKKGQAKTQYATAYSLTKYETYQTAGPADDRSGASGGQTKGKREAREGQDSTRDTKDTYPPLPPVGRMSGEEFQAFRRRLESLAGDALADPANSPSLINPSPIAAWLDAGAHPELDIAPAVQATAARAKRRSIRSWEYFARQVAEYKARRENGLPAVELPADAAVNRQLREIALI